MESIRCVLFSFVSGPIANFLLFSPPPLFFSPPPLLLFLSNLFTTAHARHTCLVNRWAATEAKSKCANCYCYVCDGKASLCPAWEIHCHAFPSQEWKQARSKWKREAAQRNANGGAVSAAAAAGHAALVGAAVGGTCKCTHLCSPALMFMKYTFARNPVVTTGYGPQRTSTYAAKFKCVDCTKIPPQPLRSNLGTQMYGAQFVDGATAPSYYAYDHTKLSKEQAMISKQRQAVEESLWKHMKQRGGDANRTNVDAVVSRIRFIVNV